MSSVLGDPAPLPRRGTCRACGAPVMFARTPEGELLTLEVHESARGPERYVLWSGDARRVSPTRDVSAFPVHHCPKAAAA